jgi:ATP-dependent RNA helicase DDX23/PRP28
MRQSSQPVATPNINQNSSAPAANHESSLTQLTGLAKAKAQAAEEDAMLSKPVFLTKQQREQLALQRMAEARAATVARTDAERSTRLDSISHNTTSTHNSNQRSDHARPSAAAIAEERAREKELDLIKQSYLGGPKVNKKQGGTLVSKSKVVFDWANDEDTSVDANPLYQKRADIALGFGRAFLGGIDIREQRKSAKFYDDLAERRVRSGDAVAPLPVINEDKARAREELQRVKDAERAKATRHWSEKALDEMTERDWRIFREDFNITTRGGKLPNPLRDWEEANLPYEIMDALRRAGYKEPSAIQRQVCQFSSRFFLD